MMPTLLVKKETRGSDIVTSEVEAAADPEEMDSVFGQAYNSCEDAAEDNTNSETLEVSYTGPTWADCPAGTYLLLFCAELANENKTKEYSWQFEYQINGGSWVAVNTDNRDWSPATDMGYKHKMAMALVTLSVDDDLAVRFQFSITTQGGVVYIKDKCCVAWRVG